MKKQVPLENLEQRPGFQVHPPLVISLIENFSHNLLLLFKLHEFWWVDSRENH